MDERLWRILGVVVVNVAVGVLWKVLSRRGILDLNDVRQTMGLYATVAVPGLSAWLGRNVDLALLLPFMVVGAISLLRSPTASPSS